MTISHIVRRPDRRRFLLGCIGIFCSLGAWQAAGSVWPTTISRPTRVVRELVSLGRSGDLLGMLGSSLLSLLIGAGAAVVLGIVIGLLAGRYRSVRTVLMPYVTCIYSVPFVAFVPLFVVWFGIGRTFVVVSATVAGTVVIIIPTTAGVVAASAKYGELGRSLCIPQLRLFWSVFLPAAVPYVLTGVRLAVERCLITVIVAEFLVGFNGLGLLLSDARSSLNADEVFAVAVATAVLGITFTSASTYVEHRFEGRLG